MLYGTTNVHVHHRIQEDNSQSCVLYSRDVDLPIFQGRVRGTRPLLPSAVRSQWPVQDSGAKPHWFHASLCGRLQAPVKGSRWLASSPLPHTSVHRGQWEASEAWVARGNSHHPLYGMVQQPPSWGGLPLRAICSLLQALANAQGGKGCFVWGRGGECGFRGALSPQPPVADAFVLQSKIWSKIEARMKGLKCKDSF